MFGYIDEMFIIRKERRVGSMDRALGNILSFMDLKTNTHLKCEKWLLTRWCNFSPSAYINKVVQVAFLVDSKPTKYSQPMSHHLYDAVFSSNPKEIYKWRKFCSFAFRRSQLRVFSNSTQHGSRCFNDIYIEIETKTHTMKNLQKCLLPHRDK